MLLIADNISLSLGITGIFLPVILSIPFLLLSAACYIKNSQKLYFWLLNHRILGLYIRSYVEYKAVSLKGKIVSIAALWIVISSTIIFFINNLWIRIMLVVIAFGVTLYLLRIKTLTREMIEKQKKKNRPESDDQAGNG